MSENFYRRYVLKCGPKGKKGFAVGNVDSAIETVLHVMFNIEKTDAESSNTAKVSIWNLSDENLKILDTEDCIVDLKAGYGDRLSLILVGNVTNAVTTPSNADRITELEVVDGRVELRDTNISISLNGEQDSKAIYNYIANEMGLPIVFAPDLTYKKLPNGFSFVGEARNALKKVANCNGHKWSIQNRIIQVTLPGRPISIKGYVLSTDTGLIRVPKRITIASGNNSDVSQTGWEVEYLLNGAIGVNDIVILQSKEISGYFRVRNITFAGDNMEGDWTCTAQILEIKAKPSLDAKTDDGTIKKGDKVRVINYTEQGGKKKGYQYGGGNFTIWYDIYDVIQVKESRAVIGIGSIVTAAVNVNDISKV